MRLVECGDFAQLVMKGAENLMRRRSSAWEGEDRAGGGRAVREVGACGEEESFLVEGQRVVAVTEGDAEFVGK